MKTGKRLGRFGGLPGPLHRIGWRIASLAPDAKTIALCKPGTVELRDVASGRLLQAFDGFRFHACPPSYSPDGKRVALCKGSTVEVREVVTGRLLHEVGGQRDFAYAPVLSRDGRWLAVGEHPPAGIDPKARSLTDKEIVEGRPYHVRVYDLRTKKQVYVREGSPAGAAPGAFSADGTTLRLSHASLLDLRTEKLTGEKGLSLMSAQSRFYPDQRFFLRYRISPPRREDSAADRADHRLEFIDIDTGEPIHRWTEKLPRPNWCDRLTLSPDGKLLATLGWCGEPGIYVWDVKTGKRLSHPEREGLGVIASAVSPDGDTLATLNSAGVLRLWDVNTGRPGREFAVPAADSAALGWSPDGKALAHAGASVRLLDPRTGRVEATSPPTGVEPAGLCWARPGRAVAVWGEHHAPRVWDVGRNALAPAVAAGDGLGTLRAAFSPDGAALVRVVNDETDPVRLTAWRTDKALAPPPLPGRGITTFAGYTPDGGRLIVAGGQRLRGYDRVTGRLMHDTPFDPGESAIQAFSADGRFAAALALGGSGTWRVHELLSGKQVRAFTLQSGHVTAVSFHPDGRRAVSTASDGTATVWDLTAPTGMPLLGPAGSPGWRRCWDVLGGADAEAADRRAWGMAAEPDAAVAYLAARLRPVPRRDAKRIAGLVRDLDAEDFAKREAAKKALAALGPLAEPELQTAAAAASKEVSRSAKALLAAIGPIDSTSEAWAARRGVAVLERIGTTEATRLLTDLAGGEPLAEVTRDAAAALGRLKRRGDAGR